MALPACDGPRRGLVQRVRADARERRSALLTARWLEGEALTRVNRPKEARPVIEAALRDAAAAEPGSKLHGDLLKSHAAVSAVTGDVLAARARSI